MTVTPLQPGATASLSFEAGFPIVLADVRQWVRQLAHPSDDLELLVTELVSNARDHGQQGAIQVSIARSERTATVAVSNSTPTLPTTPIVLAPEIPIDQDQIRGRGLHIASAITEHLSIEQNGDTLVVTGRVPLD